MNKKSFFSRNILFFGILSISFGIMSLLVHCSKNDTTDPDLPNIVRGTDKINCPDCTPQNYLVGLMEATDNSGIFAAYALNPTQKWFLDVPHSAVSWSSPFNGFGADLTGKFQFFSVKELSFDETNPANISFEASVLLNSVVTGQPLRDDGCLLLTFLTDANKTFEAENLAVIKTITNSAKYNTEDEGYTIDANFKFLGAEHSVKINLYYLGQSTFTNYKIASFKAEFPFNAISDFGLKSNSVANGIKVNMNVNLRMAM